MFEGTSCINDPIIISPDLAFRAEATTGEGSIWHPDRNTLFWVDIEGKTLYEYIPDLQNCRSWQFDRMVSTVVPETDSTVVSRFTKRDHTCKPNGWEHDIHRPNPGQ